MPSRMLFRAAAAAVFLMSPINGAYAEDAAQLSDDDEEFRALRLASVSLVEAIHIAESETGAIAVSAEFEEDNGAYVFEIETLSDSGVETEVVIHPSDGSVLETEVDD